jgi:YfiH family protein
MKIIQPNWLAPDNVKAFTTTRAAWDEASGSITTDTPSTPIWLKQTHGTAIIPATLENLRQEADASFTTEKNTVCAVMTADCLPLLVCNRQGTVVSAIHAGWRGLANGVVETAIAALRQNPHDLLVWIGPAIGPRHFEVGADVYEAFTLTNTKANSAFKAIGNDKWLADLPLLATQRLQDLGITHIYPSQLCTYSNPDDFFSYRRDKGGKGRLATVIWLE